MLGCARILQGFETSRAFLRAKQVEEKCGKFQNPVKHRIYGLSLFLGWANHRNSHFTHPNGFNFEHFHWWQRQLLLADFSTTSSGRCQLTCYSFFVPLLYLMFCPVFFLSVLKMTITFGEWWEDAQWSHRLTNRFFIGAQWSRFWKNAKRFSSWNMYYKNCYFFKENKSLEKSRKPQGNPGKK